MNRRLLALAVLSTSLPVLAQLPPGTPTAVPGDGTIPWLGTIGAGPVRRIVDAFLCNVEHRAAVGLRGPAVGVAHAPAVTPYLTALDLGAPVVDCVTLHGAGLCSPGQQPRDAVLFSVIDDDPLVFVSADASGELDQVPVSLPGWNRASLLTTFATPTGITVAGRSLDGTVVLRAWFDRATGTFTPMPSIAIGAVVRDVCVVDLGNDGAVDTAVLTDTELRVHDVLGSPVLTVPLAHPGGAVEPLPEPGHRGGLALLRRNAANLRWELVRILDGVADAGVAVDINGADFTLVAMTSGDVNGDGFTDVAIQDGGVSVRLALNDQALTPQFAAANAGPVLTVGDPGSVQGRASLADYDYDGVPDLLVPRVSASGVPSLSLQTGLKARSQASPLLPDDILDVCYHEASEQFTLNLVLTDYLKGFDRITVTGYSAVEGPGLGTTYFATKFVGTGVMIPPEVGNDELTVTFGVDQTLVQHPELLFLAVQFSDDDNFTEKPTFLAGATIDVSGEIPWLGNCTYLAAHKPPQAQDKDVKREGPDGEGRQRIGLITPQRSLPAYID